MTDHPITAPVGDPPPPKRPGPKDLARALQLDNIEQLADRIHIGGHRVSGRTLYKWFHRGAPFTSEAALVSWVGNQGLPVAPVQPSLSDVIDSTMAQIAPIIPAEQGISAAATNASASADATTGEPLSPAGRKALASTRLTDRQTYRTDLEIAELEKVLLHRDHTVALIKAFAHETITGLTDLVPRTLRGVPSDIAGDLRQQVREALQIEINRLRTNLATLAPKLLRQAFGEEGTNP